MGCRCELLQPLWITAVCVGNIQRRWWFIVNFKPTDQEYKGFRHLSKRHTFFQDHGYGHSKRSRHKVRPTKVPQELQHLIPYVERWGFESLDDQDAFVAEMQEQRPQEIEEFSTIVDKAKPLIDHWGLLLWSSTRQ